MRYPPEDPADQSSRRRRGQHSAPEAASRQPGEDSSVFVPGYDSRRDSGPQRRTAERGDQPPPPWYGSAAGGAAGKGPVRGYPPSPGQPPPMYPPGQFASWNRSQAGRPAVDQHRPGRRLATVQQCAEHLIDPQQAAVEPDEGKTDRSLVQQGREDG